MRSVWRWLGGVRLRLQLRKSRHSDHRPGIGVFAREPAEPIPVLVLSVEPFGFGFCGSPIHTASVRRLLTSGPERGSVVHRRLMSEEAESANWWAVRAATFELR